MGPEQRILTASGRTTLTPSERWATKLKREGRWEAFKRKRSELHRKGYSRYASYWMACEEFGREIQTAATMKYVQSQVARVKRQREAKMAREAYPAEMALAEVSAATADTINDHIRWVYDTLQISEVEPSSAPSSAAWALRVWAIANPDAFYKTYVPKMWEDQKKAAREAKEAETPEMKDDKRRQFAMLDVFDRFQEEVGE